ncbi:reverse transcriptase zinc-binding domain-containing protein [Tanacetum coccineum]
MSSNKMKWYGEVIMEGKNFFCVCQTYKDLINENGNVNWSKLIWFSQNIPKHAFILWIAVQERLATQDKIKSWGSYDMMVCSLCLKDKDSHKHLFFQCKYSTQFWNRVKQKISLRCTEVEWSDIVNNMAMEYNGNSINSVIRRLGLAASVYLLWQERNNRLFRGEKRSIDELYEVFVETIRLRLSSLKAKLTKAVTKAQLNWNIKISSSFEFGKV